MIKSSKSILIVTLTILILMAAAFSGCSSQPATEGTLTDSTGAPKVEDDEDGRTNLQGLEDGGSDQQDNEQYDIGAISGEAVSNSVAEDSKDENPKTSEEAGTEKKPKCILSINCGTVFNNLDRIDEEIVKILPKDGWIYKAKEIEFTEGESAFDILQRITKQEKIHMESNSNPVLKSKYVEGIHNLYEFDAGELSGWTFKINGKGMGHGSSSSYPSDGDTVEWVYTCDQGRDVGVTAE